MLLTNKADAMLSGGVSYQIEVTFFRTNLWFYLQSLQEKNQLPIHVLSQKATGAALVPLQLILKSCPKECRLVMDTVCIFWENTFIFINGFLFVFRIVTLHCLLPSKMAIMGFVVSY